MPYRDVNTLSIGRGFNIRDLTWRVTSKRKRI
jgi:hypothetical protein